MKKVTSYISCDCDSSPALPPAFALQPSAASQHTRHAGPAACVVVVVNGKLAVRNMEPEFCYWVDDNFAGLFWLVAVWITDCHGGV